MEKQLCQEIEHRISKWRKGHPCLREYCSAQDLRNCCERSMSDETDFGKPVILNSTFIHSHGDVYHKLRQIVRAEIGVRIQYLRYALVLLHRK
jgi:hypothetical protein